MAAVFSAVFGFAVLAYLLLIAVAMTKRRYRRYARPRRRR